MPPSTQATVLRVWRVVRARWTTNVELRSILAAGQLLPEWFATDRLRASTIARYAACWSGFVAVVTSEEAALRSVRDWGRQRLARSQTVRLADQLGRIADLRPTSIWDLSVLLAYLVDTEEEWRTRGEWIELEARAAIEAFVAARARALVLFRTWTLARSAEAAMLRWARVHFVPPLQPRQGESWGSCLARIHAVEIEVAQTKNASVRRLCIPSWSGAASRVRHPSARGLCLVRALVQVLELVGVSPTEFASVGAQPVFCMAPTCRMWAEADESSFGRPLARDTCAKQCREVLIAAGVTEGAEVNRLFNLAHSLRSACVTAFSHLGIDLATITMWGGWRSQDSPSRIYVRGSLFAPEPYMEDCVHDVATSLQRFGGAAHRVM